MSIRLMTATWKTPLKSSSKLVLLALCDNASDEGDCFPSIGTIARKCSLSERSVRHQIAKLIEDGYLVKSERYGRSNLFKILDPCKWFRVNEIPTPLQTKDKTPANCSAPPADGSPITTKEPSESSNKPVDSVSGIELPENVDPSLWESFRIMRKKNRWPLTTQAVKLLVDDLKGFGSTANESLKKSIKNGYRGLFPIETNGMQQAGKNIPVDDAITKEIESLKESVASGAELFVNYRRVIIDGPFMVSAHDSNRKSLLYAYLKGGGKVEIKTKQEQTHDIAESET